MGFSALKGFDVNLGNLDFDILMWSLPSIGAHLLPYRGDFDIRISNLWAPSIAKPAIYVPIRHLYNCRENSTNPPLFEKTNPISEVNDLT
jgi:hypothetical protein